MQMTHVICIGVNNLFIVVKPVHNSQHPILYVITFLFTKQPFDMYPTLIVIITKHYLIVTAIFIVFTFILNNNIIIMPESV